MKAAIVLSVALLAGCAQMESVKQPRALMWGVSLPTCLLFCVATATVTDAEGANSNQTVSTAQTETVSPSLNLNKQ